MSQRYLLPCSCGLTTPVTISQAGTNIQCSCGQSLQVPSIRGLKALPPEKETEVSRQKPTKGAEYNGVNVLGAIFVIGAVLLAVGIGIAGWNGYVYSQIDTKDYDQELAAEDEKGIEGLNIMQLYSTWKYLEQAGIGEYHPPYHVVAREQSAQAFRLLLGGVGLCLVALAMCTYSVLGGRSVRRST